MANSLENKIEKADSKDFLKNVSYLGAAYNKIRESKREDSSAAIYAKYAFDKMYAGIKNEEAKKYLKSVKKYFDDNSVNPELFLAKTSEIIRDFAENYSDTLVKAKTSEVASVAKEFGYKGKLPDFMSSYANESIESLSKKAKEDKKIGPVLESMNILASIINKKADSEIEDMVISQNFDDLSKIYKNIEDKEKAELAKAA